MLSISTLKGSGAGLGAYFEKEAGNKDYWSREAQHSTQWIGRGALELGLVGAVEQERFERIMDRQLPDGTQLPGGPGGKSRMGYDLTFNAPKSLTLPALVGDDARLIEAHDSAIRDALQHVEKEVLAAQYKQAGKVMHEQTGRMVAAVFRHETSRELDPQLHSHVVVANITRTGDGKWRALDGAEFYKHKMIAGAVYRDSLAKRVQKLGYEIERTHSDGRFELRGITRQQIEVFSKRRAQIESALMKSGHNTAKAAEVAALSTRKSKEAGLDKAALREAWKAEAKAAGIRMPEAASHSVWREPSLADRQHAAREAVRRAQIDVLRNRKAVTPEMLLGRAAGHSVGSGVKLDDLRDAIRKEFQGGRLKQVDGRIQAAGSLKRDIDGMNRGMLSRKVRGAVLNQITPASVRAGLRLGRAVKGAVKGMTKPAAGKAVDKALEQVPGIGKALKLIKGIERAASRGQEREQER